MNRTLAAPILTLIVASACGGGTTTAPSATSPPVIVPTPRPGNASSFLSANALVQFASQSNGGFPPVAVVCSPNPAGCSGTTAVYGTSGLNQTYNAYSSAAYGILKGYASVSISGSIQSGAIASGLYSVINGFSAFDDTFTVSGAQSGTLGTLTATFTVSGSSSSTSSSNFAGVSMFAIEGSASQQCEPIIQRTGGTISCRGIPITFDEATEINFQMSAVLNILDFAPGSSAVANYADTAVLTGIAVYNNAGNPVLGFSILSGSGTKYTADGVVPRTR